MGELTHPNSLQTLIRHHEREAEYWQDMADSLGHIESSEQWRLFDMYSLHKESHEDRIAELKAKLNK